MPRIYTPMLLQPGAVLELEAGAARHVQVLRLQPGDGLTLFGSPGGGEWQARVHQMGRSSVAVEVGSHTAIERMPARRVELAVGMPANERMDWLVEKATELGVHQIQPLLTERSVVRLSGERAERRRAHWQAVAIAACEQCGGNAVPRVLAPQTLNHWLDQGQAAGGASTQARCLLSLREGASSLVGGPRWPAHVAVLSGPEGGLTPGEEALALQHGFAPYSLGPRTLRAETAALAAATWLLLDAPPATEPPGTGWPG